MVVSVEVKVVVVVGRGLHLVPAGHAKNSESIRHCLDVIYLCIKKKRLNLNITEAHDLSARVQFVYFCVLVPAAHGRACVRCTNNRIAGDAPTALY